MEVTAVDPRDQTWELDQPRYRVYFHDAVGATDEHEVMRADVGQVIAWAEAQRGERAYVLYVCVPRDGLGLVRLAGVDPHAAAPSVSSSPCRGGTEQEP
ncbi:MAG: hypothetical protein L0I76_29040 [Pseudonocardia sp.]|nr:hypothetical protein [Pseudonocardia sp.]